MCALPRSTRRSSRPTRTVIVCEPFPVYLHAITSAERAVYSKSDGTDGPQSCSRSVTRTARSESGDGVSALTVALMFRPDFAATDHVALAGLHAAWAVKLRLNGDEEEMLRLLPWICEAVGRVTPAGGETRGAIVQPDGAVRLNELICPFVGVRVKVYEPVVPAGTVPGVTVAVAAPGAADTTGASTPMRRSTPSKISGVRQRGVNNFTACLLTGRRNNAFAVPRPADRRMAEAVSRW